MKRLFVKKFFHKKIILISSAILFSGIVVGWAVLFSPWKIDGLNLLSRDKNLTVEKKKPAEEAPGFLYQMEPFIVNLADSGPRRYLKIRIVMESSEPKVNGEYEKRLPQLRDNILVILSNKVYNEIVDSEGKQKLREEIKGRINQVLQNFKVQRILFTEFIMQ
jgi:flagellar FliL protein